MEKITQEQIDTINKIYYEQLSQIRKELQEKYEIEKLEDLIQDDYEQFLYDVQNLAQHTSWGRSTY